MERSTTGRHRRSPGGQPGWQADRVCRAGWADFFTRSAHLRAYVRRQCRGLRHVSVRSCRPELEQRPGADDILCAVCE
ncbi:MAG TPA: hypothetical protein DIT03_11945 [Candidatus Accumulibacter sp.]|nr:hypothetical protein [Accumulibacter sp.]HCN68949.1 hypothetical protein [Accumulibacter sp.]